MTRLALLLAIASLLIGILPVLAWLYGIDLSRGDGTAVLCVLAYGLTLAWLKVIADGVYGIVRKL